MKRQFRTSPHEVEVKEMEARIACVPYPAGSGPRNRYVMARWKRDAEAAGYPLCEECGTPITRSHWRISTVRCQQCRMEGK